MILRAAFIADGPSDEPLSRHLEALCLQRGANVRITTPDLRRLPRPPGRRVVDRLRAVLELGTALDLVFVHRDAERQNPQWRYDEIAKAVAEASPCPPAVAVVPVRMTEAWLLLDEETLRKVAGRPRSTVHLNLPPPSQLEACPDPKSVLREVLDLASGLAGRRLRRFRERFGENRRIVLDHLDIDGPVRQLPSWQALEGSIDAIVTPLIKARITPPP